MTIEKGVLLIDDEVKVLREEREALFKACNSLLEARAEKKKYGKTMKYQLLATAGWQELENAIFLIEARR